MTLPGQNVVPALRAIPLGSDERALLTTGELNRYVLGTPDTPTALVLNDADAYGCLWWADEPEGWDFPTINTPVDRRQGGDGGYAGTPTLDERVLTVNGTVTAPTHAALRAAKARLMQALLGRMSGLTRYSHVDEDGAPGLWVKPATGRPKWAYVDERAADFSFLLVAEDPYKTGAAQRIGPVFPADQQQEGGREGNVEYEGGGRVYEGTSSPVVTVGHVPNGGDAAAHALYEVLGPIPRPIITVGEDQYVAIEVNLDADDLLRVNTATGEVTVNGGNRYDAWGAGSTWPLIPAGGAEVRLRSGTGQRYPAARLFITAASTWK